MPFHSSGSVIGEGEPLKAYANITPTVHLFGDTLSAKLAVVADTRWVDPTRLRVQVGFAPYTMVGAPTVLRLHVGRFEQLTWTWQLRCLTARCVPVAPPSETFHVFRFPPRTSTTCAERQARVRGQRDVADGEVLSRRSARRSRRRS